VVDPHVQGWTDTPVLSIEDLQSELSSFDLAIMVTDHSAFDTDKIGSLATQVLDCRHSFRPRSTVVPL
jgi:UDP-N-acetyl-D-mannosaminuronate dehydrogenase